jgi:hypothetical protein
MKIDQIFGAVGDPGSFIREELEQGLEPITTRVDALEKKLDLLLLTLNRIEALLKALQPLTKIIGKIPFLK